MEEAEPLSSLSHIQDNLREYYLADGDNSDQEVVQQGVVSPMQC